MRAKISCLLLDLDATLVDTAADLIAALHQLESRYNLARTCPKTARAQVPNGALALVEASSFKLATHSHLSKTSRDELAQQLVANYQLSTQPNTKMHSSIYPHLDQQLSNWESKGLKWGVVTNKPRFLALPLLTKLGLSERLSILVCPEDTTEHKPQPQPLLLAAQKLGVATHNCVYIGDDSRDIEAAKAAQMYSLVAAYDPFVREQKPHSFGADGVVYKAQNLLKKIAKLKDKQQC